MVLYIQIAMKSINQTFLFSQVCKYTWLTWRAKKGRGWVSWLTTRFLSFFSHACNTTMAKLPLICSYKRRAYPQIAVFYASKLFSQLHFLALFFFIDLLMRYKDFRTGNKTADIFTLEHLLWKANYMFTFQRTQTSFIASPLRPVKKSELSRWHNFLKGYFFAINTQCNSI